MILETLRLWCGPAGLPPGETLPEHANPVTLANMAAITHTLQVTILGDCWTSRSSMTNRHKSRAFLDLLLMHILVSLMGGERGRMENHGWNISLPQRETTKWPHTGDHRTTLCRSLPYHLPVSNLLNNPAEFHVHVSLSMLAYRQ